MFVHILNVFDPGIDMGNNDKDNGNTITHKYIFFNGKRKALISTQAYKRWIRDRMTEISGEDYSTLVEESIEMKDYFNKFKDSKKEVTEIQIVTNDIIQKFRGMDLFGYVITSTPKKTIPPHRQAVIAMSPLVSIIEGYNKFTRTRANSKDENSLTSEIPFLAVYKNIISIDVNRIGKFTKSETYALRVPSNEIIIDLTRDNNYVKNELSLFLNAMFTLNAKTKRSSYLANFIPIVSIFIVTNIGTNPFSSIQFNVKDDTVIIDNNFINVISNYYKLFDKNAKIFVVKPLPFETEHVTIDVDNVIDNIFDAIDKVIDNI